VEAAPHRSQCKALVSSRSAVATAPRTEDKSERPVKKERKEVKGTTGKKRKKEEKKKKKRAAPDRHQPTEAARANKTTKRTRQSVTFGLLTFRDHPTLRQANKRRDTQKDERKLDISGGTHYISCPHSVTRS
jgi:hypothetical protein